MSKKNKRRNDRGINFKFASKKWLAYTKLHVKRSTYENYVYLLNKHIYPYFGNADMYKINCSMLNAFTAEKLTNGRLKRKGGISKKYLQDMLSIVRSVIKFSEQEYGIPNKIHSVRGLKGEKPKFRILKKEEQTLLTGVLMKEDDPMRLGILLSLYTGMRIGEVCGLKWKDFHEDEGTVTIRRTVQRISDNKGSTIFLIGTPKTQTSARIIPLPGAICKVLSKSKGDPDKAVISDRRDYAEPSELRKYFKRLLKKCGIKSIRYHDLRHTFASNCVQLDFDIKTLSEILGHADVSMTLNRYVHSSLQIKRHYMGLINI